MRSYVLAPRIYTYLKVSPNDDQVDAVPLFHLRSLRDGGIDRVKHTMTLRFISIFKIKCRPVTYTSLYGYA
jgi:hypothetical protein